MPRTLWICRKASSLRANCGQRGGQRTVGGAAGLPQGGRSYLGAGGDVLPLLLSHGRQGVQRLLLTGVEQSRTAWLKQRPNNRVFSFNPLQGWICRPLQGRSSTTQTCGDKSEDLTRKQNPGGNTFKDSSEGVSGAEGGGRTADGLLHQQLHGLNTHTSVSGHTGQPGQDEPGRTHSPILGRATTWGRAGRGPSGAG